jgi:hypothetical protein
MVETVFIKNMKKWVWSWLLGQALVFLVAGIWFSATIGNTVQTHATQIKDLDVKLDSKADLATVMRIKGDADKVNQMILEDLKYIRERIDLHMERDKK